MITINTIAIEGYFCEYFLLFMGIILIKSESNKLTIGTKTICIKIISKAIFGWELKKVLLIPGVMTDRVTIITSTAAMINPKIINSNNDFLESNPLSSVLK